MRIVCPDCQAAYEVPESLLGAAPRMVRCARCQREWTAETGHGAMPPAPEPSSTSTPSLASGPAAQAAAEIPALAAPDLSDPSPPAEVEPAARAARMFPPSRPVPRLEVEPTPQRQHPRPIARLEIAAALVLSLVLLLGLAACAVVWRAEAMRLWPPSQRLFALLGLQ